MKMRQYHEELVAYIPGLCQENLPQADWPYGPDWVVHKLSLDLETNTYWASGVNLNNDEQFLWNLLTNKPLSWRYDFTNTKYYQGQHRETADQR